MKADRNTRRTRKALLAAVLTVAMTALIAAPAIALPADVELGMVGPEATVEQIQLHPDWLEVVVIPDGGDDEDAPDEEIPDDGADEGDVTPGSDEGCDEGEEPIPDGGDDEGDVPDDGSEESTPTPDEPEDSDEDEQLPFTGGNGAGFMIVGGMIALAGAGVLGRKLYAELGR